MNWNRVLLRAVSVGMAGAMVMSTPVLGATGSMNIAGVAVFETSTEEETMAVSGIARVERTSDAYKNARNVLADDSVKYVRTEEEEQEQVELASQVDEMAKEEKRVSPYDNIAISQVNNYVNIRTEASEDGEIVGKIYNNAAATIVDTVEKEDGTWYQIESGTVEGYIKSNYFVTGEEAEAIAFSVGDVKATVSTETLRLRSEASLDSSTLTLLSGEEKYDVVSQEDGFAKLKIDDDVSGYVSSDYVTFTVDFQKAVSLEEEQEALEAQRIAEEAKEAEEREQEADEEEAVQAADENEAEAEREPEVEETTKAKKKKETTEEETTKAKKKETTEEETTKAKKKKETTEEETTKEKKKSSESSSSERNEIVNYALSFVGNVRYVYGGNSLKTGVDCSGFVQQVFKHFGYSLPRTSDSQGSSGRKVSSSNMKPGDIVYYGGHVAIYIGGGEVVHASNAKTGVKVSTWNYRSVKSIRNVID